MVKSKHKEIQIQTGEKLKFLEAENFVKNVCESIKLNKFKNFSQTEAKGLGFLFDALKQKAKDSHNPHSKAAYSSILVYNINEQIKIHAGANIDPEFKEHISDPEHRRCAEKQASISASSEALLNEHLDLMFLYREPEHDREHHPEMLVPCSDCSRNYLIDLISNNGKLVLLLPDATPREFLIDGNPVNNDHSVSVMRVDNKKIFYRIINAKELPYLKIERHLGSRLKGLDRGKCEIVPLNKIL